MYVNICALNIIFAGDCECEAVRFQYATKSAAVFTSLCRFCVGF